jgi:deoxyribodipyrimidine photo-lyase
MPAVAEGGRVAGLKCLASVPADYEEAHDLVTAPTSKLSAHHHFGTVSIRESYWNAPLRGQALEAFRRQLYWRDFYGHIMNDFEGLYGVGPYEFQAPTKWRKGEKEVFTAWSKGETGVPFVDAGIHEMLATGFMHNRARLVVASWLVKDKGVNWRWGERFFAKHLVDYDPAQNMMNWIWVASVLPVASAPFRRHDPERSAKKADPEGKYIEHWLREPTVTAGP